VAVDGRAVIVGIAGHSVSDNEVLLLQRFAPAGVILFGRNIADPGQLKMLVGALRAVLPDGAVLMVDQEGGRVARLRPPHWMAHPSAAAIDVVCAPVLDVRRPRASDVVGDRAFSEQPDAVAALGGAMADGLLAAGVQPVAKHAPGHGQAVADSHFALPVVADLDPTELTPFQHNAGVPWMMTAHVLYPKLDADHPATLSPAIIGQVIREKIGFGGVLVSDDLAMGALSGPPEARAMRALAAGCDLALYCPGDFAGTEAVLRACPGLTEAARARLAASHALAAGRRSALDPRAMQSERSALLG
jgi:beta-N-acetylhexosaminidase